VAIGPTAEFPFEWPDADASKLEWKLRSIDQRRTETLRPLEQEVRGRFHRSFRNSSVWLGRPRFMRALYLNGYEYVAEAINPASEAEQKLLADAFQRTAAAFAERGQSFRDEVQFPAIDAGNAKLAGVDLAALTPADLAAHVDEALAWYERLWTDHWAFAPDSPYNRFVKLYKELFGAPKSETEPADDAAKEAAKKAEEVLDNEAKTLLTHEPNLLSAAVDGLMALAEIAQQHEPLRDLFFARRPEEILAALPETPGGDEFQAALQRLLETQGLRSGAGFGTEHSQMLPGWREEPSIVLALVQKYVPQDLGALLSARAAAIADRDRKTEDASQKIANPQQRKQFDFWLAAARAQQRGFEDHNLKIDSASTSLLHRALMAAAQRLASTGTLEAAEDVWWLRAHEITLALRGLDASNGPAPAAHSHWPALVAARKSHHAWCVQLTPPPMLGTPANKPESGRPEAPAEPEVAEFDGEPVLVKGQSGSNGVATGRVRLTSPDALVPDVVEGDVLVAGNAGPLWTPVFPLVAAVVLDQGVFFQHAMLTCREYGVPAVFQTKDATKKLQEGQRVTVDGTRGIVLAAD
jgi:phosphohistidine swiveling domain-containing protein